MAVDGLRHFVGLDLGQVDDLLRGEQIDALMQAATPPLTLPASTENSPAAKTFDLTVQAMRAAVVEAENVRESISELGESGAFDRDKLLAQLRADGATVLGASVRVEPVKDPRSDWFVRRLSTMPGDTIPD